ncbi:MAG: metallophosphoesterase [Treponema sp.]|jgi:3',5'-cyclic AMP phosphodiesterase CpdA|nr:metallophosphoesterase [Treponema sp.]
MRFAAVGALGMACFICLSGCEYGLKEFLYRDDDVDIRSVSLRELDLGCHQDTPALSLAWKQFPESYKVLVLTDIHFGAEKAAPVEELFAWLDSLPEGEKPLFCLALGDLVEHGLESEYQEYAQFASRLESKAVPIYALCGNHDLYNSGWRYWEQYVYPHASYYRFQTRAFSWYFLDTANGTLGKKQLENFSSCAKQDPMPKLVFSHYPVYAGGIPYFSLSNTRERAYLLDLFAKTKVRLVLEGHWHFGGSYDFGAFREETLEAFRDRDCWYVLNVTEGIDGTAGAVSVSQVAK